MMVVSFALKKRPQPLSCLLAHLTERAGSRGVPPRENPMRSLLQLMTPGELHALAQLLLSLH
jgi:hypothetical protein